VSGVWFTADTHFDHKLVSELRGFGTPEEHDQEVVRRWNKRVRPGDQVWHLGDVGIGALARSLPWMEQLNGTIHLITGNHDACSPVHRQSHKHLREWMGQFETVQAYARRRIVGRSVLLSHYPYEGDHTATERYSQYRLRDEGLWLLHGHTHSPERINGRQIQVGVDAWGLAPVSIDEIAELMLEHDG